LTDNINRSRLVEQGLIVSGLTGSEAVVKANAASLIDGQSVQIAQPPTK
jgi:hypothetical protein